MDENIPLITLVVVCYNGRKWLEPCLRSTAKLRYPDYEVILVDNASRDSSVQYVEEYFPWIRVIKNGTNLGYAGGCNIGAKNAKGEIIAFLNQDLKVDPDWLTYLTLPLQQEKIGACCGRFLNYDADAATITKWNFHGISKCQETRMIAGAAFATRKNVIEKIGLFDPKFFMYYEEVDWSWRLRLAGYKCIYVPDAIAYHWVGGSNTIIERIVYLNYRNRIRTLIKNCEVRTLLFFVPLIVLEMGGCFLSLFYHHVTALWFSGSPNKRVNGLILLKGCLKGIVWNITNIGDTLSERRKIQRIRVNSDKYIKAKEQDFFYWKFLKKMKRKLSFTVNE